MLKINTNIKKGENMKDKYVINGEPIDIKLKSGRLEVCCDCGLTHYCFHYIEGGKFKRVSYRDDYETKMARKKEGIVVYKRKNKKLSKNT